MMYGFNGQVSFKIEVYHLIIQLPQINYLIYGDFGCTEFSNSTANPSKDNQPKTRQNIVYVCDELCITVSDTQTSVLILLQEV